MKCIEKIYRKEGCARTGHIVCPNQYIVPKKKTMVSRVLEIAHNSDFGFS